MDKFDKTIGKYEDFSELKKIFDECGSREKIFDYFKISGNSNNWKKINQLFLELNYSLPKEIKEKRYCINCGKELKNDQYGKFCSHSCSASYNNKLRGSLSEDAKRHIREGLNKRNERLKIGIYKPKVCKFCGQEQCEKIDACSHQSFNWFNQLECFGFDLSKIGTIDINKEYNKVKELLYKEYWDNCLSVAEIKEKYNYNGSTEKLVQTIKRLGINLRNYSDCAKNALLNNRVKIIPFESQQFKTGIHTSWNDKQFFLRSSYEFDFAEQLDKQQIDYEVEWCRIKYWDSVLNTYRVAIPDFYVPSTNTIYEIKSRGSFIKQNMIDKFNEYQKLGFNTILVYEKKEYTFEEMQTIEHSVLKFLK